MHLAKKGLSPRATRKYKALDFARILVSSTETEDQVQGGFLLDVVVREGAAIFQLLSSKDQALLIRGNSFLVLDLGLDIVNGVRGLHIQGDGLSCRIQGKERVRGWSYQIELRRRVWIFANRVNGMTQSTPPLSLPSAPLYHPFASTYR